MSSPADKLCASLAGPFRNINNVNTSSIYWSSLTILSALITASLRFLVLGYCFCLAPNLPVPNPNQQPTKMRCLRCEHTDADTPPIVDALPPPYSESESPSAEEARLAEAKSRRSRRPSITRFAICTTLSIINVIAIVLIAFSIQSMIYCGMLSQNPNSTSSSQSITAAVCLWILYAASVAWASSGTSCWAIWLRNLWGGPEAAERWPIRTDIGGVILLIVFLISCTLLAFPFIIVGSVIGESVKLLRGCLRRKPSNEEEVIEVERAVGPNSGNVAEDEDGGSNRSRRSESVHASYKRLADTLQALRRKSQI